VAGPSPWARIEQAISQLGLEYEVPHGWERRVNAAIEGCPRPMHAPPRDDLLGASLPLAPNPRVALHRRPRKRS